jgi:hypothetical protein
MASDAVFPYLVEITLRIIPHTSSACSDVAVFPVPIAHTGSYAMMTFLSFNSSSVGALKRGYAFFILFLHLLSY